jgi:glycosyltransferase involved in cell wall biosynthesis
MRVVIASEARFDRTPDGACWNVGSSNYEFWRRYLTVFDEVCVLARVRDVERTSPAAVRADGQNVSLASLPYYIGIWGCVRRYRSLRSAIRAALRPDDAVIVRAPGITATMLLSDLDGSKRPFGIEIVGDPWSALGPGGVRTILRPLLRRWGTELFRNQCARACAAAYVTSSLLQQSYPATSASYVTAYSSIDLDEDAFVSEPRSVSSNVGPWHLVSIGTLEQLYKAPDVVIDAVAIAFNRGADVRLTWIGDGKHRRELEERAAVHGITDRIQFLGHVTPGDAVRQALDCADLFVLASRTEGLPRALIEAMARALPCIGSDTGGIRELIPASERVAVGDANDLATKILQLLSDPERLRRLSRQNLQTAREYHAESLRPRRHAFYRAVHEATLRWQH